MYYLAKCTVSQTDSIITPIAFMLHAVRG